MSEFTFCCSAMPTINGFTLRKIEPNAEGWWEVPVGCLGMPTRSKTLYDTKSFIEAMNNPTSRFNITLKDGNLHGEWGHPDAYTKDDIPRLLKIDEHFVSHYFGKIWVGETITIDGRECTPIYAWVKPTGPYGQYLEQALRDPTHNTAFSHRTLCLPAGEKDGCDYRIVQILVTFDAVHAPGFTVTSKRYSIGPKAGNADFGIPLDSMDIKNYMQYAKAAGMENISAITMADFYRLQRLTKQYTLNGEVVATGLHGNRSIRKENGEVVPAASLIYRR